MTSDAAGRVGEVLPGRSDGPGNGDILLPAVTR